MAEGSKAPQETKRNRILTRWATLRSERSEWFSHWKEISTVLLPRNGRFFTTDRNRGQKRHNNIYDSTGTRALRVLAAGMMAGMTSPARPWFRLSSQDPEMANFAPVKHWLSNTRDVMLSVIARSNTYNALHHMYSELGAFGTGADILLPDFTNVVHNYPQTTGEYCLGTNYKGEVNALYREFQKTVGQLVGEFGYKNCSKSVRNMYDRSDYDQWVTVLHGVEPRAHEERDVTRRDGKNMPWRSTYIEHGAEENQFLRDSGFQDFRVLAPRWDLVGGDIYGHSPGMEALGDIKQLQHEQLRKANAIDYQTKPPLQVPTSLKNDGLNTLPGGVSYYDAAGPSQGIRSAWDVNLNLDHLLMDIQDVRQRINSAFYADLFLMLAQAPLSNATATEIAERHEEKLLMLGPVLERLHNELLKRLIDLVFTDCLRAGILPPPPAEMQGQELKVEFVSMLAQAQRAVSNNAVDRFVGNIGMIAQMKPDVLDKFDSDRWADIYSDALGVDPEMIVSSEQVALIRDQRAQAMQQQQQAEQQAQAAATAKDLAAAKTAEPSALTDSVDLFSGYQSA